MNILIPHSWLKEFVTTKATPKKIAELLTLHSASVERLIHENGDWIYDIEITTNRVDMASVSGIAREVAVVLNQHDISATYHPAKVSQPPKAAKKVPLTIINDHALCRRVLGIVLSVDQSRSPDWIKDRVVSSGVRSLNTLVDITNYVMLETGHPTHVFDYDRIESNTLRIRESKKGETITTFEGKNHTLPGGDIVIDDGSGTIIDLPGIAGSKNSVVTPKTKRILFFVESIEPTRIRQTCMNLGIHTYASNINKNKPDSVLAKHALLRGIELYIKHANGTIISSLYDDYVKPDARKAIRVPRDLIETYVGTTISDSRLARMLRPLGFEMDMDTDSISVTPPTWRRHDVTIAQDVIEEIARLYGYHAIESRVQIGKPVTSSHATFNRLARIKVLLKHLGFTELYTSSLVSADETTSKSVALKNPLTEEGTHLRTDLTPGVRAAVQYNMYRADELRLFELSRRYRQNSTASNQPLDESRQLVLASKTSSQELSISEMTFAIRAIGSELGILLHLRPDQSIMAEKDTIGSIHLEDETVYADIDIEKALAHIDDTRSFTPIPEHPPIREDVTLELPPHTYIGPVIQSIKKSSPLIQSVTLVDRYKNNVTFRIEFQHPKKSLTEDSVSSIKDKILKKDFAT